MTLSPSPGRGPQSGFAVVAVLILIAVTTALGATYLRHAMLDPDSAQARGRAHDAREAGQSAMRFAQQALATEAGITSGSVDTGRRAANVQLASLTDPTRASVDVDARDANGMGTRLLAEIERIPVSAHDHPDDLPRLSPDRITEILNDSSIPKTYLGGQQHITDTDYEGVVVIENSAGIFFNDVTVKGCVVSADVLDPAPFGDFGSQLPCLLIDDTVRIDPADFLPGVAVIMPDGVIRTWDHDESVLINGDVVAHTVMFNGPGAVNGNIAAVSSSISTSLELPSTSRGPLDWGSGLDDLGTTWTTSFMAYLPRYTSVSECQPMIDYSFPSN